MKVTVIGSGYVGLVTGACLAEMGNQILCVDVDQQKIDLLNRGEVPIYEPGLAELIARNKAQNKISFTTDIVAGIGYSDVIFIAVGTPPSEDGSADLQHVLAVAESIARNMSDFKVIVNKSTVPVGTADMVNDTIKNILIERKVAIPFSVVSNPEFLKEGAAIEDFMRPDRIVIGSQSDLNGLKAKEIMRRIYAPFNRSEDRTIYMDVRSAELTKYAANAMLATRISFMNELANLADKVGADIDHVRRGIGSDSRIGSGFLYSGIGYGGSCFPKDVKALLRTSNEYQVLLDVLEAVEKSNEYQKLVLVNKVISEYGENLSGKVFGVWGLSFKPNTDDMRSAPSRNIISKLIQMGARVKVYDPVATLNAKKYLLEDLGSENFSKISFMNDMYDVLPESDGLLLLTEWKIFQMPDFEEIEAKLKGKIIFDGRNIFNSNELSTFGLRYIGIGKR